MSAYTPSPAPVAGLPRVPGPTDSERALRFTLWVNFWAKLLAAPPDARESSSSAQD